jgi:hypothetical protein
VKAADAVHSDFDEGGVVHAGLSAPAEPVLDDVGPGGASRVVLRLSALGEGGGLSFVRVGWMYLGLDDIPYRGASLPANREGDVLPDSRRRSGTAIVPPSARSAIGYADCRSEGVRRSTFCISVARTASRPPSYGYAVVGAGICPADCRCRHSNGDRYGRHSLRTAAPAESARMSPTATLFAAKPSDLPRGWTPTYRLNGVAAAKRDWRAACLINHRRRGRPARSPP